MILVAAATPRAVREIRRAVGSDACIADSIVEVFEFDHTVEAVVIGWPGQLRSESIDLLARFEREYPWMPVLLVTDPDPELAKHLVHLRVTALIWFSEIETHLRPTLDAVCATRGLSCLAETFERSSLPPALRRALVHAVRQAGNRPVRNARELATAARCARVTLFRQFRAQVDGTTTLSAFLRALSILRINQLRRAGLSWKQVVCKMEISRATIAARARTWPGCTLGELERLAADDLLAAFTASHVQPILPRPSEEMRGINRPRAPYPFSSASSQF